MKNKDVIRAWKDPAMRKSFLDQALAIPAHPAGWIELDDELLGGVTGGVEAIGEARTFHGLTLGCCTGNEWCEPLNSQKLFTFGCC